MEAGIVSGLKVEVEEQPAWRRVLTIELPAREAEGRLEAVLEDLRRTVSIPGFRKGKVPTADLRRFLGASVRDEFFRKVMPAVYEEALGQANLRPISDPEISEVQYEPGLPFRFKVAVDVRPALEPDGYRGLHAKRKLHEIDERDIEEAIQFLRIRRATYETVDREARYGDFLEIEHTVPADPDEGSKPRRGRIELGAAGTPDEFNRALMDAKAGDSRTIPVPIPEDHPDPALRGTERVFEVKLLKVTERKLPPLDDAFAQEALQVPDLEHLRQRIRLDLEAEDFRRSNDDVRDEVLTALLTANPFELPASLVAGAMERLIERAREERVREEGKELTAEEEGELRERYLPRIEREYRIDFLLAAIASREGIAVTNEEIEAEIAKIAASERKEPSEVRAILKKNEEMDRFTNHLFTRKVLAFLMEAATVETEKTPRR